MVGIVCFIDVDCYPEGLICQLSYRIDNQSIISGSVIGGYHIQAISNLKQSCHIILIRLFCRLGNILPAQLLCHSLYLLQIFFADRRHNLNGSIQPGNILALLKHPAHHLGSQRSPGTILNQSDGTLLVSPLR